MTIETDCTVLCSMLYTRSCLNLIGWFQVTATLRYMLGWIPVGLSSLCIVDSLCQTMKWASAGAVEGVHGMLFPGCGHISHRTASLTPFPFAVVFAAKVHTHSPTLPLVSSLHQIQFLLLHAPCRAQGKGVREAVLGEMWAPLPLLHQLQFLLVRTPCRALGRGSGGSPRGDGPHPGESIPCTPSTAPALAHFMV